MNDYYRASAILPCILILMIGCSRQVDQRAPSKKQDHDPYWLQPREIVVDRHYDEGPANRYTIPYEPIVYGQKVKAPLPGLAYEYELCDWDQDGLQDIIAMLRRGGGLVFYKNIGTTEAPLFRSLHENKKLMTTTGLARKFSLADFDGDGRNEVVTIKKPFTMGGKGKDMARVSFNNGTPENPDWEVYPILHPTGDTVLIPGRFVCRDWNGDDKPDIIYGYHEKEDLFKFEISGEGARPWVGFRSKDQYNTDVERYYMLENISEDPRKPVFEAPELLTAGEDTIFTYIGSNPEVYDIDKDGLKDLVIGTDKPGILVYLNQGTKSHVELRYAGMVEDEVGNPVSTIETIRLRAADLDGDGMDELVGSAYFGNMDRFVLYDQQEDMGIKGWRRKGYLSIMAGELTPVYGYGNSTIDPVDWDGDGDHDLLLGAEPAFISIVINAGNDTDPVYQPAERLKYLDGTLMETYPGVLGEGSHWGPGEWYNDRQTPRAVDWDDDGVMDVISGSSGRRIYFFKGQIVKDELRFARPELFRMNGEEVTVPDRQHPAIVDWNKDGAMDMILNDMEGRVTVWLGNKTTEFAGVERLKDVHGRDLVFPHRWANVNRIGYDVADWNGDGNLDLLSFRFHLGAYVNYGTRNSTFFGSIPLVPVYSHQAGVSAFDWDQDGILDLLIGGDERRMIEPNIPAHLAVFHGEHTLEPPKPGRNE